MITVPEKTIAAISFKEDEEPGIDLIVDPMQGKKKRDWFVNHAYFCLPLTIGNQYGIGIRCLQSFTAIWTGGETPGDVVVILNEDEHQKFQFISSVHRACGPVFK